jgi:hypothetical protein
MPKPKPVLADEPRDVPRFPVHQTDLREPKQKPAVDAFGTSSGPKLTSDLDTTTSGQRDAIAADVFYKDFLATSAA